MNKGTLSERIADVAAAVRLNDLHPETLRATKKIVLDTIGITLAGTKAPGCEGVVKLINEMGGKPACTIIGYGIKAPPPQAAFANATMAHAFEFDDTHDAGAVHTGSVIVNAALAMGEWGGCSGADLLLASAVGLDLFARLGLAPRSDFYGHGFVYTPALGPFAAAVAAGKILGFDAELMVNAMGIAYDQASGTVISAEPDECVLSKRLLAGEAALHGILSAMLAQAGITGPRGSLDGKWGFYNVYTKGEYDRQRLLEGLGETFEVANIGLKPYPSCRYTHAPIEAMLEARTKYGIRPENVDSIDIEMDESFYRGCGQPLDIKANPRTVVDAQFSIPYCAACALVQGDVFIDDFTEKGIKRPDILSISNKIKPAVSKRVDGYGEWKIPGIIATFRLRDGGTVQVRIAHPTDHPLNPMGYEARLRKFRRCAKYGVKALTDGEIEEIINRVDGLERLSSVYDLTSLLG